MIIRDLLQNLREWRVSEVHKPLLLRGARQVGKTWLVRQFAKEFVNFVEINFEKDVEIKQFFEGNINITTILEKLSLYTQKKIIPGETLLFFDEIQECERAITALRYFKEELPTLHLIAAGSLVDFVLDSISVPVGRLSYLFLQPLSFAEFLTAVGEEDLRKYLLRKNIDKVFHNKLLEHLRNYFWLGGMPEIVHSWITHRDVDACHKIQDEIIRSYQQDFMKYSKRMHIYRVDKIFNNIPRQLGQKFVYKKVDPDEQSVALKSALMLLQKAGIAHIVYHTAAQGLPLAASINEKRFKVFFLDIGLVQRLLGTDQRDLLVTPMDVQHLGALAEQFVAQEYIANNSRDRLAELHYWHRENKHSNAEVDFIFVKDGLIIPAEVKSGARGKLKSLHLFLTEHKHSPYGLRVSELPFSSNQKITSIPLYGIEAWSKR